VLACALLLRTAGGANEAPSAVLRHGAVVGDWVEDVTPHVARFRGIPFAASTAGAGRWAPPSPPDAWGPAPLLATAFGPACVQAIIPSDPDVPDVQSEDCLSLNVYTPALGSTPAKAPVPVMLFFHGGAFVAGSNAGPWGVYDGSRVASRGGVVVVTANYRLDALGWMTTSGVSGATGNYGLLDQRAAMRWVRDNVGAFGGDPSRVTLWGESAGAMSGLVHMASPPSAGAHALRVCVRPLFVSKARRSALTTLLCVRAGLFQRVIMQSNPAGFAYTTPAYMAVYGDALASQAGCGKPPKGTSQLDCLRNVSSSAIMARPRCSAAACLCASTVFRRADAHGRLPAAGCQRGCDHQLLRRGARQRVQHPGGRPAVGPCA
jgi:carboxylesterase type B